MEILLVGLGSDTSSVVNRLLEARNHKPRPAISGESALQMLLERAVPLIVLEDPLSDMRGADFCRRVRALRSEMAEAVILVISKRDEELLSMLDAGATDLYVTSLGPSALEMRLLIAERLVAKQAELRARDVRFRRLFESGVAGVTIADLNGNFKEANDAFLHMLGFTRAEMLAGKLTWDVITPPDWLVPDVEAREQLRTTGFLPLREREYVHKDGHHISAQVGAALLADTGEYVTYITDLTEKKKTEEALRRMEEQLRQGQKMEAIGSLAGGVSHDFNNLLSIILSYSELIADDLTETDPMRADLNEIRNAGLRAVDLTRQLLAFSRQQVLQPKIVDLTETVRGMESMLQRLIGEDVELSIATTKTFAIGKVLVDPGQMEQVIMNLVVNARDAMPQGGKLTIETSDVFLDESYAADHIGARAGPHVMLAVADTGVGMDKATQTHIFEPFFTTKGVGKGTGLGLATVFGIVAQSGGTIWVYSEPDVGTCFKVYFPLANPSAAKDGVLPCSSIETLAGSETVLLVEDDAGVRHLARTILSKYGYDVLEAQNGHDALLVSDNHPSTIHLLVTDVVMPRMSGRQLAEELQSRRPDMRVLYLSGYTDDAVVRHGILNASVAFLQKPITPEPLARKVRETLLS